MQTPSEDCEREEQYPQHVHGEGAAVFNSESHVESALKQVQAIACSTLVSPKKDISSTGTLFMADSGVSGFEGTHIAISASISLTSRIFQTFE